jgi:type I restriction enzyme S subunit
MMNKSWIPIKLGKILTERQEKPDFEEIIKGNIPIVAKIGFNTGQIILREESDTKTNMILIRPGDLVISGINAAKGAIAIYDETNSIPAAATIHYSSYKINKKMVNPTYLWYFLRSNNFQKILLNNLPGGIKTEVRPKRLLPIQISLPICKEQDLIVKRIEMFALKIAEAHNINHKLKAEFEIFMESFIQAIMDNYIEKGLKSFAEVITFKPRSGPSFITDPDWSGTPVLMPSSVTGFGVNTTKVEYGIGTEEYSEKDILAPGDILIARGNKKDQVGNAGVVPEEAKGWVCANLLMRTQVDTNTTDPHFCIYWLRSPYMRILVKEKMKGTNPNIQKINQRNILNFPFPKDVPLDDQQRIVAYLDNLEDYVNNLKHLQTEIQVDLDTLLPSVLHTAFKGELTT